jgi:hypothetical protein
LIVVSIDLWPHGDESRKRTLAAVAIANVGGDERYGDYECAISHQAGTNHPHEGELSASAFGEAFRTPGNPWEWKRVTVRAFPRALGSVRLLARVLKSFSH